MLILSASAGAEDLLEGAGVDGDHRLLHLPVHIAFISSDDPAVMLNFGQPLFLQRLPHISCPAT